MIPGTCTVLRELCLTHDVLLVFDEIATGFGRTGELFAAEHAGVSPDIMCVGKALTGGYLSMAATLCTTAVARGISDGEAGGADARADVHGQPALASAVALAAVDELLRRDWRAEVAGIGEGPAPPVLRRCARAGPGVRDVRGARARSAWCSWTGRSTSLWRQGRPPPKECGCARSGIWSMRCHRSSRARPTWPKSPPRWWLPRWPAPEGDRADISGRSIE